MSETHLLDVRALADAGAVLDGNAPLAEFPRLVELSAETDANAALMASLGPVRWVGSFSLRRVTGAADQPGLHLQVDAQLPLVCQRCLVPYAQATQIDRDFAFVADEKTAEALDDESEVDLLVSSRQFDLKALIEDELLMATSVVPMHEVCPQPVVMQAGEIDDVPAQLNPFAELAALKKDLLKKPENPLH